MNTEIQTLAASVTKIELQVRIRFLKLMLSTQNTDKFVSLLDQYLIRFPLNQFSEAPALPLAKTPAIPQKPTDSAPESQPKIPQIQKLTSEDRRTIRRSLVVFATAELNKPSSPQRLNFLNRLLTDPLKALSRTKNSATIFNHPRLGNITSKIIRESVVKTPPPIKLPQSDSSAYTPRKSKLPRQVPSKRTIPGADSSATPTPISPRTQQTSQFSYDHPYDYTTPQDSLYSSDSSVPKGISNPPLPTPSSVPTTKQPSPKKSSATPTPSSTIPEKDDSMQKMHAFVLSQDKAVLHGFTPMQAANYLTKLQKMNAPEFHTAQSKFTNKESALSAHYFSKTGLSLESLDLSEDFLIHKEYLATLVQRAKK